jgi:hypothetical protein
MGWQADRSLPKNNVANRQGHPGDLPLRRGAAGGKSPCGEEPPEAKPGEDKHSMRNRARPPAPEIQPTGQHRQTRINHPQPQGRELATIAS